MAYERQYYTNGDVLDARQMNHMETGIKENSDNIDKLSEDIATKASAIKETASGEVLVVTDSTEAKPLGLAIDGKSEQNQYSGVNLINFENLAYSSGVAYTFKDDILVVVGDGKSGYQCVAYDVTNLFINNIGKNVSFGFEKITETVTGECSVELMLTDSDNKTAIFKLYDGSKKTSYVYTIPSNISSARFRIYTSNKNESNVVTNTVTIEKPMLYIGSEKTDYEPFTNLQPSPSPSYPQEIRNIGVYEEASGKYAVEVKCTTEDGSKETTTTVLLDEPLRKEDKAYWNGGSKVKIERYRKRVDKFNVDVVSEYETTNRFVMSLSDKSNGVSNDVLCNIAKSVASGKDANTCRLYEQLQLFLFLDKEEFKDKNAFTSYLAENNVYFEYTLEEPITEEIDLSLDGLSMFYPTTVISNDCNANMEVEYIADTKNYIDKLKAKHESDITALKTAIVALGGTV